MKLILSGVMIEECLEGMEVDFVEGQETAAVTAAAMGVQIEEEEMGNCQFRGRRKENQKQKEKLGLFFSLKGAGGGVDYVLGGGDCRS